jgi:tRNA uridine 5-carbamoylmethylation protein Kti12
MTWKFSFTGSHGTGKTTAAYDLATALKKEGYDVNIITEAARSHPKHLPINENATIETQEWIFAEMLKRELEANAQIAICDRTLLDVFAYTYRVDNTI